VVALETLERRPMGTQPSALRNACGWIGDRMRRLKGLADCGDREQAPQEIRGREFERDHPGAAPDVCPTSHAKAAGDLSTEPTRRTHAFRRRHHMRVGMVPHAGCPRRTIRLRTKSARGRGSNGRGDAVYPSARVEWRRFGPWRIIRMFRRSSRQSPPSRRLTLDGGGRRRVRRPDERAASPSSPRLCARHPNRRADVDKNYHP
jgi:hypothetical protein